jgi:hypothetical protein
VFRFWRRPSDYFKIEVQESYTTDVTLFEDKSHLIYFATKRWKIWNKKEQITIVPWTRSENDGPGGGCSMPQLMVHIGIIFILCQQAIPVFKDFEILLNPFLEIRKEEFSHW